MEEVVRLKATGIVRRIDDLGRIVIPKEIRRTLRIREGDPLEIFTDNEGEIILKKYSPIGELGEFASQYAESLHKTSGHITCIADKDSIIAVSGASKKDFIDKSLSQDLEKVITDKSAVVVRSLGEGTIKITADENGERQYTSQMVKPIISEGDPVGAVIFLSTDPNARMGEVEQKLMESAAGFLGKQVDQ